MLTQFASDVRFALRTLRRTPLFTTVAVLSLALGIGANTAVFTLLDQLILRLLPVRDPHQLVMIWSTGPHMGNNRGSRAASYPMYQDFQRRAQAFSYVFCRYGASLSTTFDGRTERVEGELVSGNYFQALGVKPAIGRLFTPEQDDRVYKGHPAAVLSYQYWLARFGGDPSILGKKILVNDYPLTVVGVSAPGFTGLDPARSPQIRIPIEMKPLMTPGWDALGDRRSQWIQIFARMKPGFTVASATASLQPLLTQVLRDELTLPAMKDTSPYYRDRFLNRKIQMEQAANGYSQMRRDYGTALIVLMCMTGLVLLIACFNVANLLIARAVSRRKEIAVRLAVGAGKAQLIRQLLVESLALSIAGGLLGLLLSMVIIRALLHFLPTSDGAPLMLTPDPDFRILAFNGALALLTGLLFGLAPALQSLRIDLWNTLKDVVGTVSGSGGGVRLRKSLVTAQVAFSFLLLAGSGLFVRTLVNLRNTNSGFHDIDKVVSFQLDPGLNGYSVTRIQDFYRRLIANIRATPGVKSAAYAMVPLLAGDEWDSTMGVEGHPARDGEDMQAFMNGVSTDYWKTLGVRLVEGRDFTGQDTGKDVTVAIVNEKFARHFFGNRSAIGRHIGFGDRKAVKLPIEIIGVAADTLYEGPREGVHRQVFAPMLQADSPIGVAFYVRTSLDAGSMFNTLRAKVRELDSSLPVYGMKTLAGQLDETLSTERLIAALSAAFGVLATLLAALGLYGVMAFVVARRTREIGLRMALGAPGARVLWMVLRETLALTAIGLALGIPAALAVTRYVSTQLYGVKADDLTAGAAALVVLSLVAVCAGFLPARRASTIDPNQALRYE